MLGRIRTHDNDGSLLVVNGSESELDHRGSYAATAGIHDRDFVATADAIDYLAILQRIQN